jgi:ribosomal protein L7/L12
MSEDHVLIGRVEALQQRVGLLEQQLAAIVEATGVSVPTAPPGDALAHEVQELLSAGNRMKAIKQAQKSLGVGLQEATEYVGEVEGTV